MYQQSIFSTKGNTFDSFKLNAPQKSTFLKLVFNAIHREALTDKDKPFRIAQLGWQTNVATAIRCCGDRHTITWRPPYDNVATATHTITWRPPHDNVATATLHRSKSHD